MGLYDDGYDTWSKKPSPTRVTFFTENATFDVEWTETGLKIWKDGKLKDSKRNHEVFQEVVALEPIPQKAYRRGPSPFAKKRTT